MTCRTQWSVRRRTLPRPSHRHSFSVTCNLWKVHIFPAAISLPLCQHYLGGLLRFAGILQKTTDRLELLSLSKRKQIVEILKRNTFSCKGGPGVRPCTGGAPCTSKRRDDQGQEESRKGETYGAT